MHSLTDYVIILYYPGVLHSWSPVAHFEWLWYNPWMMVWVQVTNLQRKSHQVVAALHQWPHKDFQQLQNYYIISREKSGERWGSRRWLTLNDGESMMNLCEMCCALNFDCSQGGKAGTFGISWCLMLFESCKSCLRVAFNLCHFVST